jgi:hypothetical protein
MSRTEYGKLYADCPRNASEIDRTTRQRVELVSDDDGKPYPCEGSVGCHYRDTPSYFGPDGGEPEDFDAGPWGACDTCGVDDWTAAELKGFDEKHRRVEDQPEYDEEGRRVG